MTRKIKMNMKTRYSVNTRHSEKLTVIQSQKPADYQDLSRVNMLKKNLIYSKILLNFRLEENNYSYFLEKLNLPQETQIPDT